MMRKNLKIIFVTALSTTLGWVVVIAIAFRLLPTTDADTMRFPEPTNPNSLEWQAQKGEFIVQLVSSNLTTSASSVLFSRTSRPPERIWFQTLFTDSRRDK
jgi:hypothetical protein